VKVRVHRNATEELAAAAAWYDEQRRGLGDDLLAEVDWAIAAIEESPEIWPIVRRKTALRRFLLSRFPYAIIYACADQEIRVFAVAHTRRRPGFWRRRQFR
jgi:toxin ParE1/3/4